MFASTTDVAAISNMKANAVEKLKEKQQCLKAIKIALDQSKTKRDEQVGLMRGAAKIIERLNKDMEELKLHKAGLVPNEEAMAKLETLIQIRKEALKDMGHDIEVHNLDNLGEEAAQLQTVVTGVYMLRCQHPYHPLCFLIACKSVGQCLFHGCEEPLKYALKLLAPGEANMDEHVGTEKDPMEGIFGSPVDGIAHSQAGSSRKPNIDSMCGGCGDKNASQKQESAEVPLKPKPAMNKDVEDTEKSSEKQIEKDTTVNLSDEDVDLLILDVCGEILGRRKKRSNTEERATPKKNAKVASEPAKPTPRGEVEDVAGLAASRIAAVKFVLPTAKQALWDVKDAQAHALIALSVKRTITPRIRSTKSAKQAWDILGGLYASSNEAKIALLRKELESKIMNEKDDMDNFLVGVKDINEQLIFADKESSDESSYWYEESYTSEESSMEVMGLAFQQPKAKGSLTSKEV
ncbi:hypothetical protein L7F22_049283 [Adiantum nelumboides]|nr:hypothetical protein [Adiantum nelumboides]